MSDKLRQDLTQADVPKNMPKRRPQRSVTGPAKIAPTCDQSSSVSQWFQVIADASTDHVSDGVDGKDDTCGRSRLS